MRAEYFKDLENHQSDEIILDAKENHHLIKVARLKNGESIKLLDGNGFEFICEVTEITKKEIHLRINEKNKIERKLNIDAAICINKKDQMDSLLKIATELGVRKIIPIQSEYSVADFKNNDRVERLLVSAMKQSNNPYLPIIEETKSFSDIDSSQYSNIFCFSMNQDSQTKSLEMKASASSLIVIGPEGGLSHDEEQLISSNGNVQFIHLPTPILRATTALATAFGHVLTHYGKV